ncbi:uncharacterized protein C2orf81 homolog isoform X3 [Narcine bancroftii]|uniref:uncharacterized protein C2orf81 homolog isoform X3 n=1 Tax=Narcine bancroftii TaxID=1343680 RepID=UPI003831FE46
MATETGSRTFHNVTANSCVTSRRSGRGSCQETAGGRSPESGLMSRSAVPKTRLEKSRTTANPASTSPATFVDIVPGRFTENDWQSMVAAEDGENNIMDIIEDIVSQALDQCYNLYIENQLLPFTISQAKDAILQIIEWQFLSYDPGESNVTLDHSWQEDREPKANVTDSWAQGSVPVVRPSTTAALEKQEPETPLKATTVRKSHSFKATRYLPCTGKSQNISKTLVEVESDLTHQQASEVDPEVPQLPCEAYWMPPFLQNVLKIQQSRLPSNNSMTFDEFGNVTSVKKLEPSQFHKHQTRPVFQLVDGDPETKTCRPLGNQILRPLVFQAAHFGERSIPGRHNSRRGRQLGPGNGSGVVAPGRVTGRQPSTGSLSVKRLKLPITAGFTTQDLPEFISNGAKDQSNSKCGRYPEHEELGPSRLKPICGRLLVPPIPVEQLASHIML